MGEAALPDVDITMGSAGVPGPGLGMQNAEKRNRAVAALLCISDIDHLGVQAAYLYSFTVSPLPASQV